MGNRILTEEEYNHLIKTEDMYKKLIADCDELRKDRDNWRDWFYELRYTLRKDEQLDESISCVRDIPSDVEMIEDLKKRAADSDCYKEMAELLKERNNELKVKLKNVNELADSWKRDYERLRDYFIYPIYNILYPDKADLDINVTDLLNDVKNLKIYSEENETMYKEIKEWRKKCIARGDEISKLQNIVTEKEVELKKRLKDNVYLTQTKFFADTVIEKNKKLKQTISDQEITIKALLITIKEMCKEENENA